MKRIQSPWLMTVCADIGILIFAPLQARHFERATALEIVWLSLIFMQAAFLLSWRARAKKDNFTVPANFYLWAVLLALATGAATSVIVMKVAQPSSYTDLANSSISLDDIQPVQKRLVIELLRKDIAATQANTASVKGMKPIDPGVYSPASLADVNAMQSTVEQLQKSIDIDANYNAQLKLASDEFRTKMMVADPTYLQGWDAQRKAPDAITAASAQAELLWWQSVQDFYAYAELHAKDIVVQDNKLGIHDSDVRNTFNSKLDSGKALYADWQTKMQADAVEHKQAQ